MARFTQPNAVGVSSVIWSTDMPVMATDTIHRRLAIAIEGGVEVIELTDALPD